jgi:hypothetical protein
MEVITGGGFTMSFAGVPLAKAFPVEVLPETDTR